jgi:hypothetical protein
MTYEDDPVDWVHAYVALDAALYAERPAGHAADHRHVQPLPECTEADTPERTHS